MRNLDKTKWMVPLICLYILFQFCALSTLAAGLIVLISFFSIYLSLKLRKGIVAFRKSWYGLLSVIFGVSVYITLNTIAWLLRESFFINALLPFMRVLISISLLGSFYYYSKERRRELNDFAYIDILGVALISSIYFTKWLYIFNYNEFRLSNNYFILDELNLILNFIILGWISVILALSKVPSLPKTIYLLIVGITTFVMADFMNKLIIGFQPSLLIALHLGVLYLFMYALEIESADSGNRTREALKLISSEKILVTRYLIQFSIPGLDYFINGWDLLYSILFITVVVSMIIIRQYVQIAKSREQVFEERVNREKLNLIVKENSSELEKRVIELQRVSREDDLTKLNNRRSFLDKFSTELKDGCGVLYYMDLDYFNILNETYGHNLGDQVIVEIADRLSKSFDENVVLSRSGADEFFIFINRNISDEEISEIAHQISLLCTQPMNFNKNSIIVSCSIGIVKRPIHGKDILELLKSADIALHEAKSRWRGSYYILDSLLLSTTIRKNQIFDFLKSNEIEKEIEMYYQPQFRVSDGRLIGAEALMRWNNAIIGRVSPVEFIPIAEETGHIVKLGEIALKQSMNQIKMWHDCGINNVRVGVNISPKQLEESDFIGKLKSSIIDRGINPELLDIEITESCTFNSDNRFEERLSEITNIGCVISIDDFGTGYSSLSYIKRFRINKIKIARELIDEIAMDEDSKNIVNAIIAMSKSLKLTTIAEGVETIEQLKILQELGCDEVQGFLLGKPAEAKMFEKLYLMKE